jgi:hypothetical protein
MMAIRTTEMDAAVVVKSKPTGPAVVVQRLQQILARKSAEIVTSLILLPDCQVVFATMETLSTMMVAVTNVPLR